MASTESPDHDEPLLPSLASGAGSNADDDVTMYDRDATEAADDDEDEPPRGRACRGVAFGILAVVIMAAGGIFSKQKVTEYLLTSGAITADIAHVVAAMNTSASPCDSPWQYACGQYAAAGPPDRSTLGDAQERVHRAIWRMASSNPKPGAPPEWASFLRECAAAAPAATNLVQNKSAQWMLERGLPYAGVSVSRGRDENTQRRERVAVVTDHVAPGECVWSYECDTSAINFDVPIDDELCVATRNPEALCARLSAPPTEPPAPILPSRRWCVREAIRLWPTSLSAAWADTLGQAGHNQVRDTKALFERLQLSISATLARQRQHTLASAVRAIELLTTHGGPPEQYKARAAGSTFAEWWAEVRREHHHADMALRFYTREHWQMAGTDVNAYYDSLFNAVYVTPAIMQALWEPNVWSRTAKLGFVIAHEIGHSIHSQDLSNVPIGSRAAFTAGQACLINEYQVNGSTVTEDMADRVAASAVVDVLGSAIGSSRSVCNPDCIVTTDLARAFVSMAQVWCTSADPTSHYNGDPHSPNRARVDHTIVQTPGIMQAWECPALPRERQCPVVGA